jgi:hypothetical protein
MSGTVERGTTCRSERTVHMLRGFSQVGIIDQSAPSFMTKSNPSTSQTPSHSRTAILRL